MALDYRNYGTVLTMGNAGFEGFISSTVVLAGLECFRNAEACRAQAEAPQALTFKVWGLGRAL